MEAALLYLLKANLVLALFAAAYYGLLRRLTFFGLNRIYLLLALVFAAVYPALPMPGLLPAEATAPVGLPAAWLVASPAASLATAPPAVGWPDCATVGLLVYAVGAGLLLARLLVQLVALVRLRRTTRPATTPTGVPYRQLPAAGDPFSFGRTIYLHAEQYSAAELVVVLAHEQAHISQHHTADVLLAHLGTALFWVNPAAWLLRRALLDNLEFLADAATLRTGLDRRAYQYCLLQLSRGPVGPALALPFSFLTLKNRVAMMNTPLSTQGQLARYFLAGPLVILAALGYSAAHARSATPAAFSHAASLATATMAPRVAAPTSSPLVPAESPKESGLPALPLPTRSSVATSIKLPKDLPAASPSVVTRSARTGSAPLYYLDGQLITEAQYKTLKPADIASIYVLKGEQARQLSGDNGSNSIVAITTTATKNAPAVLAFNQRVQHLLSLQAGATFSSELPTNMVYYVDGQQVDKSILDKVDLATMVESINMLKAEQAQQLLGMNAPTMIVTTKANAHSPAVLAFNKKAFSAYNFTQEPAQINALVPKTLAYITSHYPDARLSGEVTKLTEKDTGAVKYRVQLIKGRRPFDVYFSPQGDFLGEV